MSEKGWMTWACALCSENMFNVVPNYPENYPACLGVGPKVIFQVGTL